MEKLQPGEIKVTLITMTIYISDKMKVAKKLHSQFFHPPPKKLLTAGFYPPKNMVLISSIK